MSIKFDTKNIKIPKRQFGIGRPPKHFGIFDQLKLGKSFHVKSSKTYDRTKYLLSFKRWKNTKRKPETWQLVSRKMDNGFRFWMINGEK